MARLARCGPAWRGTARPIQYAQHPRIPLALWDVWTPIAGLPVAFEPPVRELCAGTGDRSGRRARGIGVPTITLAAGICVDRDPELDRAFVR